MGKFLKGQSGNPKGRAKGSRNKVTLAAEQLLRGEAKTITRKCIAMAKAGDPVAMKLALDRIVPARKDHFVSLKLPRLKSIDDVTRAQGMILNAMSDGRITPTEADAITSLVRDFAETLEMQQMMKRLEALEKEAGHK